MSSNNSSRIIIFDGESIPKNSILDIIYLRHPKTREKIQYIFQNNEIYELNSVKHHSYSSWFIDSNVEQDGNIYLATKIDPLFLILPYLWESRAKTDGKYCELSTILNDSEFTDIYRLNTVDDLINNIYLICDIKTAMGTVLYRINDNKVLNWLKSKIIKIESALGEQWNKQMDEQSFNTLKTHKESQDKQNIQNSLSIIYEYITNDFFEKLCHEYSISPDKAIRGEVQTTQNIEELPSNANESKKKSKKSNKQLKAEKIDTSDMKSLHSYFSVIPKKK